MRKDKNKLGKLSGIEDIILVLGIMICIVWMAVRGQAIEVTWAGILVGAAMVGILTAVAKAIRIIRRAIDKKLYNTHIDLSWGAGEATIGADVVDFPKITFKYVIGNEKVKIDYEQFEKELFRLRKDRANKKWQLGGTRLDFKLVGEPVCSENKTIDLSEMDLDLMRAMVVKWWLLKEKQEKDFQWTAKEASRVMEKAYHEYIGSYVEYGKRAFIWNRGTIESNLTGMKMAGSQSLTYKIADVFLGNADLYYIVRKGSIFETALQAIDAMEIKADTYEEACRIRDALRLLGKGASKVMYRAV